MYDNVVDFLQCCTDLVLFLGQAFFGRGIPGLGASLFFAAV